MNLFRHTPNTRTPRTAALWLSAALNLVLCIAVVLLYVHPLHQPAKNTLGNHLSEEPTIPVSLLQQYANQYNISIEFLQNFFPDSIVYKDKNAGGIVYAPIDPELPKNDYNWDNLVYTNGRVEYQKDGETVSKLGIDISKYQGDIDWEAVKSDGIDFAILRVGARGYETGKLNPDESFHQNARKALDAGLEIGVYFYTQAITPEEAREEADFILEQIREYDITYPVVFDTEDPVADTARTNTLSQEERTDITIAFCEQIRTAGYRPMIYANIQWFMANLELSRLTEYDKWFAQYFQKPFFPYEFQMWQYTAQGSVDGIQGNVDLNVALVDYTALEPAK